MEQLVVLDNETNQEFYLEKVERQSDDPKFAFFSKDAMWHLSFSSIQPPRYIVIKGDIENPVAKDINTGLLINCNDFPESL